MKKRLIIGMLFCLLIFVFGCSATNSSQTTQQQKAVGIVEIPMPVFQGLSGEFCQYAPTCLYKGPVDATFRATSKKDNGAVHIVISNLRFSFSWGGGPVLAKLGAIVDAEYKGSSKMPARPRNILKCRALLRKKGEETYTILDDNVFIDDKEFYLGEKQTAEMGVVEIPPSLQESTPFKQYDLIFEFKSIFD